MKYFIVILVLLLSSIGWSQQVRFIFRGKIENIDLGKKEGGVTVTIVQSNRDVSSVQSASSGKYTVRGDLDAKAPFEIVFSKSGLVSKRVRFDFSKMNDEDTPASAEFEPVESLDIDLFKDREGLDFSFLDTEPVAAFDWNEKKLGPKLDQGLVSRMKRKVEDLLNKAEKEKAELEAAYQAALQAGQVAYDDQEYEKALVSYEAASGLKPDEKLPADRIIELDALIKAQKESELVAEQADSQYNNLIDAADNLRDKGELQSAVSKYKEAITKKPEQYPKDQVEILTAQIAALEKEQENQTQYDQAILAADNFMTQNSVRAAKDKYTEAVALKPTEQYPKDKLREIEEKMNALEAQEAKKKQYDDAIAAADLLYTGEDYQGAKDKYQEALTFESAATYPKERMKMCDTALAESETAAALATKIAGLIKKGTDEIAAKSLEDAKVTFTQVLTLDDQNEVAPLKLIEIEALIAEANDVAAQEKKYTDLITAGDLADRSNKLEDALANYIEAKGVKDTPEVQAKIKGVQVKIDDEQALADKEGAYNDKIEEAAAKLANDDLKGAKADYEAAAVIDPAQTLPGEKIEEINGLLGQQAEKAEKAAAFENLVTEGQTLLTNGKLDLAKAKYQEAGILDPSRTEPQEKIVEIDGLIAEATENAQRKTDYNNAIADADRLFNEAKWDEALSKYREAMTFDGENPYPGRQLAEIDGKIKERDDAIAQKEQITNLLADGKDLVVQEKLEDARNKFQEVLALDPTNTEATAEIATINTQLAILLGEAEKEEAFNALKEEGLQLAVDEKYPEAKQKLQEALALKEDAAVTTKIIEIDELIRANTETAELDRQYNELLTEGETRVSSGDLNGAITSYEGALNLKPNEQLPKDKLEGVRTKLANDAAAEQLAAEQLLAEKLEADYTKLMDEGLAKEANGDVNGAISNYEGALELKPNEQLPKGKIQALRNQIANQEDVNLQYREAIDNGDQSMGSEDYQNAITLYNQAIALRPSEQEAKDKLKLAQDAEEERGGAKAQYDKILSAAQENIDSENITKAEELIGRAEVIDPADTRPAGLREQVKVIRLAQAKYQENMNLGEAQASSKNYQEAIGFFELAKKDRPSENEPSSRILEMNRLIGVASSVDQREKLYQDNMAKGLATETGARFPEALSHYQNALSIKPGDQPATDKISEIQQILDDIANANSGEIEKKNKFDAIIIEANEFFAQKNYVGDGTTVAAKEKYEEALTLYPSNSYALTQRDECVRLAVEGVNSEVEAQYAKLLKVADKKFDKLDYDKAKELYTRAVGLKEADPYPKKKLAEIDAILNPLIAESVELKDLGIPIDATIEDGGFILAQDEAKRSLIKKTRIQRKADKAYASQQEMTALKTTDRLATRNEIVRVLNLISVDGMDSDDNRLALIEALRIAEKELNLEEQKNNQFERSDNLATQETLYSIAEDVSLQQTSDANSRKENAIDLKKIQVALAEENTILSGQYVATSYEQDARITNYVQLAIDEVQDDYDERLEIEAELNRALDQAYQVKLDLGNQRTDATLNQQDELDGVRAAVSTKIAEDAQVAGNNNEELKGIRSDVAATADNFQSENLEHSYQTNAEIAEVNRLVIADNQGFEKIRVEASERLKVIKTDKLDADRMAYNGEVEKHLSSQAAINSELEKRKDIQIIADEAMVQKVANAELMSEKARSSSSQAEMTDEVARQNVVQSVNLISMRMKEKEIADAQKVKDNAKLLNDARKTRGSQAAISQEEAKEKALANQQAIHNVDNSPQAKPRIKNALGEEYPEGVSQESFKNVDNEGLMKSIITRRVVVIEGHADVYVRTQTLYGITYSKNSNPSLSNVWNSETQGPDLVRHY